ncbi:MAG: D-2-hydroxyacid dehydrogenase [Singulisphaera sp.]
MNRRTFLTNTGAVAVLSASGKAQGEDSGRLQVLVPKMTPEGLDALRAVAPEVELVVCGDGREALEQAADADASYGFISAELLRAGKKLRWVQQGSAGVENVVGLPEMARGDLVLTNMQRTYAPEIADQALGYLLAFTRHLDHDIRTRGDERWRRRRPEMVFEELEGKTMLIVALGGIGSHIARRARGFGMHILATDPKVIEKPAFVDELHKPEAFRELLPRADVVASAVPLTPASRKMIGADAFARMKRGVLFLNVSRGGVVDTDALVQALKSGQVAAAGLDVTDPEPLPQGHPLWDQNVIITPHTAGQSPAGTRRAFELFRENVRRFAHGEMLLNVVDKSVGY